METIPLEFLCATMFSVCLSSEAVVVTCGGRMNGGMWNSWMTVFDRCNSVEAVHVCWICSLWTR